jgi:hypothetical protein
MGIQIALNKDSYGPGDYLVAAVTADPVSTTIPVAYTITASRTVNGVAETAEVTAVANYPVTVSPVTVTTGGGLELAQDGLEPHKWVGTVPTAPPA